MIELGPLKKSRRVKQICLQMDQQMSPFFYKVTKGHISKKGRKKMRPFLFLFRPNFRTAALKTYSPEQSVCVFSKTKEGISRFIGGQRTCLAGRRRLLKRTKRGNSLLRQSFLLIQKRRGPTTIFICHKSGGKSDDENHRCMCLWEEWKSLLSLSNFIAQELILALRCKGNQCRSDHLYHGSRREILRFQQGVF